MLACYECGVFYFINFRLMYMSSVFCFPCVTSTSNYNSTIFDPRSLINFVNGVQICYTKMAWVVERYFAEKIWPLSCLLNKIYYMTKFLEVNKGGQMIYDSENDV